MKTDKELLMLASKAAGLKIIDGRNCTGAHPQMNFYSTPMWNPLTRDGDALRLAVDLGLAVQVCNLFNVTVVECAKLAHCVSHDIDKHAATRRAIVRAAAAIGEGME